MISAVIPTLNDERRLVPTLGSLVPGAAEGLIVEAIVADGGSSDDTEAIADIAGCRFLPGPADLGRRLALAAGAAKAPWLLFVPPGIVLDEGWIREVRAFIESSARRGRTDRAAVFAPGCEGYDLSERLAALGARAAFLAGLGPASRQGLLVAAGLYAACGGHPPGARAERVLARRIGRRRTVVLRTRAIPVEVRRAPVS